jgi:hypothetical protein
MAEDAWQGTLVDECMAEEQMMESVYVLCMYVLCLADDEIALT